jgi:serine/threonine-protein kinase
MAHSDSLTRHDTLIGGKYRLGPVIGSGGVATVYSATHIWTEREVALKVLDPTLPHFDKLREGFLREARATVRLDHPHVVDVLDMGEDDWETVYLVMELIHGPTLRDVLLERGRLSARDTLAVLLPLVDALIRAHELGIVHRDFKPENIMLALDSYGAVTPKLLDFGVAEILEDVRSRSLRSTSDLSMGTPQYMSPEQARDERERIGPHTDVWGVGVVWYECLTGCSPFDGDSTMEVLQAVCEAPIDFGAIPEACVPLLQDALRRSPAERIQTLSELKTRIDDAGPGEPSAPPPSTLTSSWPSSPAGESHVQRTLSGMGPRQFVPSAPRVPQVDSELLHVPFRSNRRVAVGGLALAMAVALAAWWTVRGPVETARVSVEPVVTEAEQPAELGEPSSPSAEALPPAPKEAPSETAPALDPEPPARARQLEEPLAEPAPEVSRQPPRKAQRRNRPQRRTSPPSEGSHYRKPPDLVTEW